MRVDVILVPSVQSHRCLKGFRGQLVFCSCLQRTFLCMTWCVTEQRDCPQFIYYAMPFKALFVVLKEWFARWLFVNLSIAFFMAHYRTAILCMAIMTHHDAGGGVAHVMFCMVLRLKAWNVTDWLPSTWCCLPSGFWQIIQPLLATGQTHIHISSSHFLLLSISNLFCLSRPFTFSTLSCLSCPLTFSNFLVFLVISLSDTYLVFPVLSLTLTFLSFLSFHFL